MKHALEKAFTLVEPLIVIGIIGVLAVTLLVSLNPGEAQKKARDAQRIKNLTDLQAAIELYLAEGNTIAAGAFLTTATSNTTQVTCADSCMTGDPFVNSIMRIAEADTVKDILLILCVISNLLVQEKQVTSVCCF